MSFNPDRLWQQRAQIVQQQPQFSSPDQNTSQSHGANHQQTQQNRNWSDGSTQYQSQQTWSYQTHITTPVVQPPLPLQTPQSPALALLAGQTTLQNHSHQQLHSQMHQSALTIHAQAMAHHQQVQQSIAASMNIMNSVPQQAQQKHYSTISSAVPQMQIQYQNVQLQQPLQQAQITYQTSAPTPPTAPLAMEESIYQRYQQPGQVIQMATQPTPQGHNGIEYLSSHSVNDATQQTPYTLSPAGPEQAQKPSGLQIESPPAVGQRPGPDQLVQEHFGRQSHDDRFAARERRRSKDLQAMNREGAAIQKRLRDLEDTRSRDIREREAKDAEIRCLQQEMASKERKHRKNKEDGQRLRNLEKSRVSAQKESEAKDREIRALTEQVAAVERLRRQEAARNSQQMAEFVRSQSATPAVSFDMSALQRVIEETKAQQLSSQDIERVIEEQVSKRLAGMATKADIQDAGVKMQTALSAVPKGLSEAQVQHAVNRELNNVMEDVARRVRHQRGIGSQRQRQQISQGRVQTEFVVEELPEDPVAQSMRRGGRIERNTGAETREMINAASMKTMPALPAVPTTTGVSPNRPEQHHRSGTPTAPLIYQRLALGGPSEHPNNAAGEISRLEIKHPAQDPSNSALVCQLGQGDVHPHVNLRDQREPVALRPAQTQHCSNMPSGVHSLSIRPPEAQKQLEGPPLPSHDRGPIGQQLSRSEGSTNRQPASRQIQAATPQRQIEATGSNAQERVGNGLELVRQEFDVDRRTPR